MKEDKEFSEDINKSAKEFMKAKKTRTGFWHYASLVGIGGWLFVIPIVAGAYLGKYLDRKLSAGISWSLTCMILGIFIGAYNVWYFYKRRVRE